MQPLPTQPPATIDGVVSLKAASLQELSDMILQRFYSQYRFFIVIVLLSLCCCWRMPSQDDMTSRAWDEQTTAILAAAEAFFTAMNKHNYPELWKYLSEKSKAAIVGDVYDGCRKLPNSSCEEKIIANDFKNGGIIAQAYWNNFLVSFDTDAVTKKSVWSMGDIRGGKAEIIIAYRGAKNHAALKMFKEDRTWRVGLEETFRPLRLTL